MLYRIVTKLRFKSCLGKEKSGVRCQMSEIRCQMSERLFRLFGLPFRFDTSDIGHLIFDLRPRLLLSCGNLQLKSLITRRLFFIFFLILGLLTAKLL
jgi:hypothetical protein